jgi:phosphoserine aminotransferase
MSRVYNFSAGPSMLPEPVLVAAARELLDYRGSGMSVMELSHRSKEFRGIIERAEQALRRLMNIPAGYSVLFLQGGASTQFAMVPMNLSRPGAAPGYVNTGNWSKRAIAEAKLFGEVTVVASSQDRNFSYVPRDFTVPPDASYLHITSNNTLEGTRFTEFPRCGPAPLVADMSSEILSRPIDVSQFGLIYAGAQKNIGPAGLTIVIVRDDLIGRHLGVVPTMMRYDVHREAQSLYNTPSCYAIYIAGLVFEWLEQLGGVSAIAALNEKKAAVLYDFLDQSSLFSTAVRPSDRSLMNVPFTTPDDELNEKFLAAAESAGLRTLRGHRLVGGMRASLYNAMPIDGVRKLTEVMQQFEESNAGS